MTSKNSPMKIDSKRQDHSANESRTVKPVAHFTSHSEPHGHAGSAIARSAKKSRNKLKEGGKIEVDDTYSNEFIETNKLG